MLCMEIIAICSEIHIKHINTLRGQNVEFFLMSDLVVYIVTNNRLSYPGSALLARPEI